MRSLGQGDGHFTGVEKVRNPHYGWIGFNDEVSAHFRVCLPL